MGGVDKRHASRQCVTRRSSQLVSSAVISIHVVHLQSFTWSQGNPRDRWSKKTRGRTRSVTQRHTTSVISQRSKKGKVGPVDLETNKRPRDRCRGDLFPFFFEKRNRKNCSMKFSVDVRVKEKMQIFLRLCKVTCSPNLDSEAWR